MVNELLIIRSRPPMFHVHTYMYSKCVYCIHIHMRTCVHACACMYMRLYVRFYRMDAIHLCSLLLINKTKGRKKYEFKVEEKKNSNLVVFKMMKRTRHFSTIKEVFRYDMFQRQFMKISLNFMSCSKPICFSDFG